MTDSENINIRNCDDVLYFSTIKNEMFCDCRLPSHGLMYVISGHLQIECPQSLLEAGAGEVVFWQRDCTATMRKLPDGDVPFRSIAITFQRTHLKSYFRNLSLTKLPKDKVKPFGATAQKIEKTEAIAAVFNALQGYSDSGENPANDVIGSVVVSAVDALLAIDLRFYPTFFDFYETWKIDLYEFMDKNYTEDMSMEEFASYTGRSLATFKRDFAKISDLSPQKWLISRRLDKAKQLLSAASVKPSEVYSLVGFKNRSHFSISFKKKFGFSPQQYLSIIAI